MRAGSAKFPCGAPWRVTAVRARDALSRCRNGSPRGTVATARRGTPPQLVPLLARDAAEGLDYFRIELPSGPLFEFGDRRAVRLGLAVDPVARDGVEGVGDGEYSSVQVYLLAPQPQRIARPVPLLVVLRDDARRAFQELDARQNLLAVPRVPTHL